MALSGLVKFFGFRAARWGLVALISTVFGFYGVNQVKTIWQNHKNTQKAVAVANKAVQDLVDKEKNHKEALARLQADRDAKADEVSLVFKNAVVEANKLNKKILELEHVANWFCGNTPSDVIELYIEEFGAGSLHSSQDSSPCSERG